MLTRYIDHVDRNSCIAGFLPIVKEIGPLWQPSIMAVL